MALTTFTRPGQVNNAGDVNALFRTEFSGLVLREFEEMRIMKKRIAFRNLKRAKGTDFRLLGDAAARYFTPGHSLFTDTSPDPGNPAYLSGTPHAKVTVNANDLLVASDFLDEIENLKNDFDSRSDLAKEFARALNNKEEKLIMGAVRAASKHDYTEDAVGHGAGTWGVAPHYTGEPNAGGTVWLNYTGAASDSEKGSLIVDALKAAKVKLNKASVPKAGRLAVLSCDDYGYLTAYTGAMNSDWRGSGSLAEGEVPRIHGFDVMESPNFINADYSAANAWGAGEQNGLIEENLTVLVGLCFGFQAAAGVNLRGLRTEVNWWQDRQGWLLSSSIAAGYGPLRRQSAVSLKSY